jgi:hypothetical protein
MKIKTLFFGSLFLSFSVNAQLVLPTVLDSSEQKYALSLRSSHDIQASAIQQEFVSKFIRGGEISDAMIQSNLGNHKEINRLGREFTNELKFVSPLPFLKTKEFNLLVECNYSSLFSANYSQDLFRLAFTGNQDFIGDTANFSGTNFKFIDFQTFGLGLSHKKTKSIISLNAVNVQNYLSSQISDGELIFAGDSSALELNLAGDFNSTFSQKFNKGFGLALNFNLNISVPWKDESTAFFQFQVRNLGFAKVQQVNRIQLDTTLNYKGFTLEELVNFDQSVFEGSNWQDTLNVKQDTVSSFIFLPVMIQFGKVLKTDFDKKIQSFFGVKMYPSLNYVPKVYAGLDYKIKSRFHAGISAAYGGFGNLRAGIYANYASEKMNIGIGTEDFYGLISKKGFGQMVGINFQWKIQ